MIYISIIEDHQVSLEKLVSLVRSASLLHEVEVEPISTYKKAVSNIANHRVDIAIMDIGIGRDNIFQLIESYQAKGAKIILYSAYTSPTYIAQAIRLQVHAYISKGSSYSYLMDALKLPKSNQMFMCPEIEQEFKKSNTYLHELMPLDHLDLTEKEEEVVQSFIKNYSTEMICTVLKISKNTLQTHRRNILVKHGCSMEKIILTYKLIRNAQQFV
jgi:DNA-binding NarL/FixJ family response regulator